MRWRAVSGRPWERVVKQASPGGQHPGVKRVDFELMAAMSEHARLEARPVGRCRFTLSNPRCKRLVLSS
jgi:hypothetical protein